MCVPGVHACAIDGVTAIAIRAIHAAHRNRMKGCLPDSRAANLDPDPLALPAHRFAEIAHLGAYYIVDRFTSAVDIFADRVGDVFYRNRIDQLFTSLPCCAITSRRLFTSPAGSIASALRHPSGARCRTVASPSRSLESRKRSQLRTAASAANDR